MLDLFRRKKRGLKWTLWVVIVALSGGMVLLFVDVPTGVGGGLGNRDVALVAGHRITAGEYRRTFALLHDNYRQTYGLDPGDPSFPSHINIPQQALDQLITEYILTEEARRLGLSASPEEVAQQIVSAPVFQENGRFIGKERYQQILRANNLAIAEYEESVRRNILRRKLLRVVTASVQPTPGEVRQEFLKRHQETKLHYALIDPQTVSGGKFSDEELRTHYQAHLDQYQNPEQRRVTYLEVPLRSEQVQLSEKDLEVRMAAIPEKESVRASHILVSVDDDSEAAAARQKAEELLERLRAGEDFEEVARAHSDDPASAKEGGDLGLFKRGRMVPEFEQVAFSLEVGELSDPVRTQYGYHIIKVTEIPPLDRRARAREELRREQAEQQALNLATKLIYQIRNGASLEVLAAQHGLEVKQSPPLTLKEIARDMGVRRNFNRQIFALPPGAVIDEPYKTRQSSFLVAQLTEIVPAAPKPFEAVQKTVAQNLKTTRADELARSRAFALAEAAKEQQGLEEAARQADLKVSTTGFFKRYTSIDTTLGSATEIHDQLLQLQEGETGPPVVVRGKYVVFQVAEKSRVDEQQFEQEQEQIREELTAQQRTQFFSSWLRSAKTRLTQDQQIQINQELVDAVAG